MKGLIIDDWMSDEFFNFLFSETIFFLLLLLYVCVCVAILCGRIFARIVVRHVLTRFRSCVSSLLLPSRPQ